MNMNDVKRMKLDQARRMALEDLDLPVRLYNGLKRRNIHSLGDLEERTEEELLTFRLFTRKDVELIEDYLARYSLYLRGSGYKIPFRNVLGKLCIVRDSWSLKSYTQHAIDGCEKLDGANALLCYAYMDNMMGLTYQVFAAVFYHEGDYYLVGEREKLDYKIRAESLIYNRVYPTENKALDIKYKEQKEFIDNHYMSNENMKEMLAIEELDAFRHPACPNDVIVTLYSDKYEKCEGVWVKLTARLTEKANGEEVFNGKLLSEPWKDYGVHGAEDIYFIHHKVDDHSVLLYSPGFNEVFGEKKE